MGNTTSHEGDRHSASKTKHAAPAPAKPKTSEDVIAPLPFASPSVPGNPVTPSAAISAAYATAPVEPSKQSSHNQLKHSHSQSSQDSHGNPKGSIRSSFANERGDNTTAFRRSNTADSLRKKSSNLGMAPAGSAAGFVPPQHLVPIYSSLGVLAPDMPAPLSMLMRLWQLPNLTQTQQRATELRDHGVVRIAVLEDSSIWCLLTPEHLENITTLAEYSSTLKETHQRLLDSYTEGGKRPLYSIVDDGYIVQNIEHHLEGAGRLKDLRMLLMEPLWIENKLHAYGIAAIVSDFRKYLSDHEDANVKLLLQAFQLSLGCCMQHPASHMLQEQMLARLMAVARLRQQKGSTAGRGGGEEAAGRGGDSELISWLQDHSTKAVADMAVTKGTHLVHLMPRTATLEQAGGINRMTLRGHTAPIHKVVISPNGEDVITVSEDGSAQVWDMNIGDCVMQLARDKPLIDAAVSPGGHLTVVASQDGHCCVWDMESGQVKHVLKGHTKKVNAVAIDRQGIRCITASDDRSVRVWSIYDGRIEQVLSGHGGIDGSLGQVFDLAISSDGTMAATVSDDFTCRVWDLDDGDEECLHVMEGHTGWVVSVKFIGTTMDLVTASHDGTARVWDGWKGKCRFVLEGHTGRLNKVKVNPSGTYAVTCSDDNTARVWDLDTGKCIQVLQGHSAWLNDADISRDGKHVVTVSGDHHAAVWNVETGALVALLGGHTDNVRSVVLTFRGRFAVTASDDCTARVWDLLAPDLKPITRHVGTVKQLCALQGGRLVATTGDDGSTLVWTVAGGELLHTMAGAHTSPVNYMAASATAGDDRIITGSNDRTLCMWHAETGKLGNKIVNMGGRVKSMGFDKTGTKAAVLLYDGTASVWDLATGALWHHMIKRDRATQPGAKMHVGAVNCVYLSKDGSKAVTGGNDHTARVWDVATEQVTAVVSGHKEGVTCAAINPDESLLATAAMDASVRISTMQDGVVVAVLEQPGRANAKCVAFSPDGLLLVAVLDSNVVVVWDLLGTEAQVPLVLDTHKAEVNGACFSPEGHMLATWSQDCTVRVWRVASHVAAQQSGGGAAQANGQQVVFFMSDAAITACCFAGDKRPPFADALVVGDASGAVHFLDFPLVLQQQ